LSEHHPEKTMAVAASKADLDDLPDELIDELLAAARTPPEQRTGSDVLPEPRAAASSQRYP
jgi:hypothetical protein